MVSSCHSSSRDVGHDTKALEQPPPSDDAKAIESGHPSDDAATVERPAGPPLTLQTPNQRFLPHFQVAKKSGRFAVLEGEPGHRWTRDCSIHRTCTVQVLELSRCTEGALAPTWSELAPRASRFEGQIIAVRGPLVVGGGGFSTMIGCSAARECCNSGASHIALLGYPSPLVLQDHSCVGDKSRLCCSTPAYGQTVQASGRLARAALGRDLWVLRDVRLCLDTSDAGAL